jgi:hypothetical protein
LELFPVKERPGRLALGAVELYVDAVFPMILEWTMT